MNFLNSIQNIVKYNNTTSAPIIIDFSTPQQIYTNGNLTASPRFRISTDGTVIYVYSYSNSSSPYIFKSINSGSSFSILSSPTPNNNRLISNHTGQYLTLFDASNYNMYYSNDYGATWTNIRPFSNAFLPASTLQYDTSTGFIGLLAGSSGNQFTIFSNGGSSNSISQGSGSVNAPKTNNQANSKILSTDTNFTQYYYVGNDRTISRLFYSSNFTISSINSYTSGIVFNSGTSPLKFDISRTTLGGFPSSSIVCITGLPYLARQLISNNNAMLLNVSPFSSYSTYASTAISWSGQYIIFLTNSNALIYSNDYGYSWTNLTVGSVSFYDVEFVPSSLSSLENIAYISTLSNGIYKFIVPTSTDTIPTPEVYTSFESNGNSGSLGGSFVVNQSTGVLEFSNSTSKSGSYSLKLTTNTNTNVRNYFYGGNAFQILNTSLPIQQQGMTVSFWFKINDTLTNNYYPMLFYWASGSGTGSRVLIGFTPNGTKLNQLVLECGYRDTSLNLAQYTWTLPRDSNGNIRSASDNLNTYKLDVYGGWNHLAWSIDIKGVWTILINGIKVSDMIYSTYNMTTNVGGKNMSSASGTDSVLCIGTEGISNFPRFSGYIDNFSFWRQYLPLNVLQKLYTSHY